jgi:outer membrane murein-binding lipoprotein Lpp
LLLVSAVVCGCKSPDKANIQLRKDKQQLEAQINELKVQHEAAVARLSAYEKETGTVETLPGERLNQLFTVHKIDLHNLSSGADTNLKSPGDEALKVYLVPMDESGDPIKATGRVVVEAFDLSKPTDNRIGQWEFEPKQIKPHWRSVLRLNAFVLTCPWQTKPERSGLAVKVTFTDALTGRTFEKLKDVQVKPPSSTPATQPQQITGS